MTLGQGGLIVVLTWNRLAVVQADRNLCLKISPQNSKLSDETTSPVSMLA